MICCQKVGRLKRIRAVPPLKVGRLEPSHGDRFRRQCCILWVATLQWSNSLTFPDISDYLRPMDPRNSSDACYFMTFLWQLCSSVYSSGITSAYTDVKLIYRVGLYCTFCVKINTCGNWPYARIHRLFFFPWPLLNSQTFPGFQGSPGEWPPCILCCQWML